MRHRPFLALTGTLLLAMAPSYAANRAAAPSPQPDAGVLVVTASPTRLTFGSPRVVQARRAGAPTAADVPTALFDQAERCLATWEFLEVPQAGHASTEVAVVGADDSPVSVVSGAMASGSPARDTGPAVTWRDAQGVTTLFTSATGVPIEIAPAPSNANAPVLEPGTGSGANGSRPLEFALLPNQPNPFRHSTLLRFRLPEAGRVNLSVYDVAGRRLATVLDAARPAGEHAIEYAAPPRADGRLYVRMTFTNERGSVTRRATQTIVSLR